MINFIRNKSMHLFYLKILKIDFFRKFIKIYCIILYLCESILNIIIKLNKYL